MDVYSPPESRHKLYVASAAVAAVFAIVVTVWWASSLDGSVRAPRPIDAAPPPVDSSPPRTAYVPPEPGQRPLASTGATVVVTPRETAPDPVEAEPQQAYAEPARTREESPAPRDEDLSDMFPVRASRPASHGAGPQAAPGPSFSYNGRRWTHTGKFADGAQVQVVPLGMSVGGRDVYALANTRTPYEVLFVERADGSGRLAIYRSAAG